MIETFSEYKLKRYSPLELEFLDATKKSLNDNLPSVKKYLLSEWSKAIADACEVQRDEKIPCAYVSVSLLNTSLIDDKPALQIDFYDEQWIYGESFSRGRLNADFLFTHWKNFTAQALDEKFFVRRYISRTEIKSLFWGTLDKLTFLFACFVKYFAADLRNYLQTADDALAASMKQTLATIPLNTALVEFIRDHADAFCDGDA